MFQLTEDWGETLFAALSRAGGKAFSNMAVGYNNVDVNAANKYGVAVGNTPVRFITSHKFFTVCFQILRVTSKLSHKFWPCPRNF